MIGDRTFTFSNAQAITQAAASDHHVDLGVRAPAEGVMILGHVDVAMTDAGSDSTLAVTLEQDTTAAFSSPTELATMFTFAAGSAAGTQKVYVIPPGLVTERFIRAYFTPTSGNLSTDTFTVGHIGAFQNNR